MDNSLEKNAKTPLQTYSERLRSQNKETTIRLMGTETSGDGYSWAPQDQISIAGLLENIVQGERIYVRCSYQEVYPSGRTSLPKAGPIFELIATEMVPARLVRADEQAKTDAPTTSPQ